MRVGVQSRSSRVLSDARRLLTERLMPDPAVGSFQLMLSFVVALIVYGLAHLAVRGLLRVLVFRETKL